MAAAVAAPAALAPNRKLRRERRLARSVMARAFHRKDPALLHPRPVVRATFAARARDPPAPDLCRSERHNLCPHTGSPRYVPLHLLEAVQRNSDVPVHAKRTPGCFHHRDQRRRCLTVRVSGVLRSSGARDTTTTTTFHKERMHETKRTNGNRGSRRRLVGGCVDNDTRLRREQVRGQGQRYRPGRRVRRRQCLRQSLRLRPETPPCGGRTLATDPNDSSRHRSAPLFPTTSRRATHV